MRVRVESETKREKLVEAKQTTDEAGATQVSYKYEIEHSFYVRVVEPKSDAWSMADAFHVLAAMLPPGTQVGDEFDVFFERAKKTGAKIKPAPIATPALLPALPSVQWIVDEACDSDRVYFVPRGLEYLVNNETKLWQGLSRDGDRCF
jgi:hypothetical protein